MTLGIEAYDDDGKLVAYFASQSEAARSGYTQEAISLCLRGKRKTHRGLAWRQETGIGRALKYLDEYSADHGERPVTLGELLCRVWPTLPFGMRAALTVDKLAHHVPLTMHSPDYEDSTIDDRFWAVGEAAIARPIAPDLDCVMLRRLARAL